MKRHTIHHIILLPLIVLSLISCDKFVYDRGECPTILVFTPYMQTPCMSDSAYIGKAAELHLVISDPTSGEIIAYKHLESVDLTAASSIEIPVPNECGETYRYTIWVGATPQHYTMSDLAPASGNKHT